MQNIFTVDQELYRNSELYSQQLLVLAAALHETQMIETDAGAKSRCIVAWSTVMRLRNEFRAYARSVSADQVSEIGDASVTEAEGLVWNWGWQVFTNEDQRVYEVIREQRRVDMELLLEDGGGEGDFRTLGDVATALRLLADQLDIKHEATPPNLPDSQSMDVLNDYGTIVGKLVIS